MRNRSIVHHIYRGYYEHGPITKSLLTLVSFFQKEMNFSYQEGLLLVMMPGRQQLILAWAYAKLTRCPLEKSGRHISPPPHAHWASLCLLLLSMWHEFGPACR